jgi:hypothetical protein
VGGVLLTSVPDLCACADKVTRTASQRMGHRLPQVKSKHVCQCHLDSRADDVGGVVLTSVHDLCACADKVNRTRRTGTPEDGSPAAASEVKTCAQVSS